MQDVMMRRKFIDNEGGDEKFVKQQQRRLNSLVNFAQATSCRRQILLRYFGEAAEPCNNCDACLGYVDMNQTAAVPSLRVQRQERNAKQSQGDKPRPLVSSRPRRVPSVASMH